MIARTVSLVPLEMYMQGL